MQFQSCCILLLFICCTVEVSSEYYIADVTHGSTLSQACEEGVVAAPTFAYTEHGLQFDEELPKVQRENVAVGYFKTFTSFQNIGCVLKTSLPSGVMGYRVPSDPGLCYSACRSMYFGIYATWCYCLSSPLTTTEEHCNEKCSYPDNTACGRNKTGTIYLSVYKFNRASLCSLKRNATAAEELEPWFTTRVAGVTCKSIGNQAQVKVCCPTHWKNNRNCSDIYRCESLGHRPCSMGDVLSQFSHEEMDEDKGTHCRAYNKDNDIFTWEDCNYELQGVCTAGSTTHVGDANRWYKFTNECFKDSTYPAEEEAGLDLTSASPGSQSQDVQFWIGKIRSLSMHRANDTLQADAVEYGSITLTEETIQLEFSDVWPDAVLCYKDPMATRLRNSGEDDNKSSGIVAAYVTIPLVIVALAAAAALMVIIRRNRKSKRFSTETDPNYSDHQSGNQNPVPVIQATANPSYGDTMGNDFLTLESPNEYADINDFAIENNTNADYDATSGVNNQSRSRGDTGHVYDNYV